MDASPPSTLATLLAAAHPAPALPAAPAAATPVGQPDDPSARHRRWHAPAFGLLWLLALALGFGVLFRYAATAGLSRESGPVWPATSSLRLSPAGWSLVIFLHPHCPCSEATLGELASLMAHYQGRISTTVVFIRPEDARPGWEKTGLWESASRIPGVTVVADANGSEAARFGAETSGLARLYASSGQLLFSGGITPSRGHRGDNAGLDSIAAAVAGHPPRVTSTPVFGCSLF